MTMYTWVEIWNHFEELGKCFLPYGYYWEMDIRAPWYDEDKRPPRFWDYTNQCYVPMTDEVFDIVMESTKFDVDLYHLLHMCFGVSAEAAFIMCLS